MQLIEYNMNPAFVSQCFDTDIYKKKVYTNPVFVKETRYTLVYNVRMGNWLFLKYMLACATQVVRLVLLF